MAEAEAISFVDALHERVDDLLDACSRCGKCVNACPMVRVSRHPVHLVAALLCPATALASEKQTRVVSDSVAAGSG